MKQVLRGVEGVLFVCLAGLALLQAGCGFRPAVGGGVMAATAVSVPATPALWPTVEAVAALATGTMVATAGPADMAPATATPLPSTTLPPTATPLPTATPTHPLMIEVMRQQDYPGSEIAFEQTLEPGDNYSRYIVSYRSEGNKIYALLTAPWGEPPGSGWPVIIFNHGYIRPDEYRTTERYVAYVDGFARSGYIVFRSDYRGHGNSEGETMGSYSSPAYTIDVLNGMAAVKTLAFADGDRIGMWGHSMGGHITLRAMVVSDEIKAGVIWAGVVGAYPDLFMRPNAASVGGAAGAGGTPGAPGGRGRWRQTLIDTYGSPEENPAFWASISANAFLGELSGPLQLHHGAGDTSVPVVGSETLQGQVAAAGVYSELHLYDGDNHNLSANFETAMRRSVAFFDAYVKGP